MRAAVLRTSPGELEVVDVDVASPGPQEVLVTTAATGLCHSDLHVIDGLFPSALPCVLGHESAGVVAAVGSEVTYVEPGDHVIACMSSACGSCEYCVIGRPNLCVRKPARDPGEAPALSERGERVVAIANIGGFAEQMLLAESALVKIGRDVPLDRAALIGCGVTTGLGAALNTAKVHPGSRVAVIGCGGIGLNVVQGARIAGAGRIVAIDVVPSKLELARRFGATDVVDASATDPVEAVRELTTGGVDYSFEAIGSQRTAVQAFEMLRIGGTATLIGIVGPGVTIEIPVLPFISDERRLQGSNMGSNRFRLDVPYYLDLYEQGRLELDALISNRIGLDDVNKGYADLRTGELARSVILFD
jgi:S-(hydroxymethyl)glutathione dehydrogenase/alcohol dehydrogenase